MMQVPKPVAVTRKVLEKDVEAHLRRRMKALGGECYKWSSKNVRGVADRICIFPNGKIWFVELKRDRAARLSTLQRRFFQRMAALGVKECVVLYGKDDVDRFVDAGGRNDAQF